MIRALLIHAGPTPWDAEGRLTGNHTLPLTEDARRAIESLVDALPEDVAAVYCCKTNEACEQAARLVARRFKLRVRDDADLDAPSLGLWQGLQRGQLRFRFPTAFPRWEEAPAEIIPPDGELFEHAHHRVAKSVRKILKRNRGQTVVLSLRPMAQQLAAGILKQEPPERIAAHLHKVAQLETIEIDADAERELLG